MVSSIESLLNPNEIGLNLEAPNLEEELTRFNELFELLLAIRRETDLDEGVKVARWKILAGEPARKKLRECQWNPGEKMTIESMTAKLVKGLPTKSGTVGSIFLARKGFWRRECKPGEGFSAWLADLGAMLTCCGYKKPDEVLRDKIVCFHPDDKLVAQLVVLDKDVTLDTVIAKCRSHELAHKHEAQQLVSINRKHEPVDGMEQDTDDEDDFEADKLQDKQEKGKKNRHSEDSDNVVLRDPSPIQIPAVLKPGTKNSTIAYLPECRLKRQHAEAMARRLDAIAVCAGEIVKKVKTEPGINDAAESSPAKKDDGDGNLADEASPTDDEGRSKSSEAVEEVTARSDGVASHPPVKIVDISRLLEIQEVQKDVGNIVAKSAVPDITVAANVTPGHVDTKDSATMNRDSPKVAVNAYVNRNERMNQKDARRKAWNMRRTLFLRGGRRKR